MITVTDLRKAYGSNVAVDGVTFEIKAGETFGLLGPNGAGKTTTMHMLVGALKPDRGRIEIAGAADPTQANSRRTIGIAPQATALYEDLTGTENVRFSEPFMGCQAVGCASAYSGHSISLASPTGARISSAPTPAA